MKVERLGQWLNVPTQGRRVAQTGTKPFSLTVPGSDPQLGIEPGPHWWEADMLTTWPPEHPNCSEDFAKKSNYMRHLNSLDWQLISLRILRSFLQFTFLWVTAAFTLPWSSRRMHAACSSGLSSWRQKILSTNVLSNSNTTHGTCKILPGSC